MQGKRGLVVGIANERSYAWYIAKSLVENGAECVFTHLPGEKMERRDAARHSAPLALMNQRLSLWTLEATKT